MNLKRVTIKWFGYLLLISSYTSGVAFATDDVTRDPALDNVFTSVLELSNTFLPIMTGLCVFLFLMSLIVRNSFNPVFMIMPISMVMMNSMVDTLIEESEGAVPISTTETGIQSDPWGVVIVAIIVLVVIAGITTFIWLNRDQSERLDRTAGSNASELGDLEHLVQSSVNKPGHETATQSSNESTEKNSSKVEQNEPIVAAKTEDAPVNNVRKISLS